MSSSVHGTVFKPIALLRLLMLLLVTAVAASSGACTNQQTDKDATPIVSGPPATTFPMPPASAKADLGWVLDDGSRVRMADYRGKVLVLDFYATWCEPCRKSIPHLSAMQQRFEPQGLQVVGLNVGGPDDRVKVKQFAADLSIQYPLGFPDKALTDLFLSGDPTIPQTFVFGKDGQMLKRFIGYDQTTETELEKEIGTAVKR